MRIQHLHEGMRRGPSVVFLFKVFAPTLRALALGVGLLMLTLAVSSKALAQPAIVPIASGNGFQRGRSSVQLAPSFDPVFTNQLTQNGITWTFDAEVLSGQFANGDYWVVGPVKIAQITPAFDGTHNGWEVNPIVEGPQGLDGRAGEFDATLIPALPYTAQPNESIVKAISGDLGTSECRPCLQTAAVLTVLSEPPPEDGAAVFRPPYVGNEKPFYFVDDLRTDLLPSYEPVPDSPTLAWVQDRYQRVQLDHKGGRVGRCLHPEDHMPDYGSDIAMHNDDAALRLMLDDPLNEKMPALIAYVQYGIDLYHMVLLGQNWPDGGGHRLGQKLPLTFTAVLFGDQQMQTAIQEATFFHEDAGNYFSDATGEALFGFHDRYWSEEQYWAVIETGGGFKSHADPYGYIDGGPVPGGSYQFCCISQPWKGSALALHLMPIMKTIWYNQAFFDYVDRWVYEGATAQPDPCAPYDGNPDHYGITYGPDGNGSCILDTDPNDGIGRFPDLHGTNVDGGYRDTEFQREMWNTYRESAEATTFADVPPTHWAHDDIETLYQGGYVAGCSTDPLLYCPDQTLTRAESAVFVMRGLHGAEFDPPDPVEVVFADVLLDAWYADWVHQLWDNGYTAGCGTNPLIYCPLQGNSRAEGCVFFLRMLHGAEYVPPDPLGIFADVPLDGWEARWIEAAYNAELIPACETDPELKFCPNDPLDRAMGAHMMVQAKELE